MDEDGHLKVADFGLSKKLKPGNITHSVVGTPDYVAPEILLKKGHDHAADWWSLGVIIYEMIMGQVPFR